MKWYHPKFHEKGSVLEMEQWLSERLDTSQSVDAHAYWVVLSALASSGLPDAPIRAERWMVRLEQDTRVVPNSECLLCVLQAWANDRCSDPTIAVTRAERWLHKYMQNHSARPNTDCFNAFLDVCSLGRAFKSGTEGKDMVRLHALKAESTLQFMIQDHKRRGSKSCIAPNTESFNFVIRAWTRCRKNRDVAQRAIETLKLLESYHSIDPSVIPDTKSYAMVMDAIALQAKLKVKYLRTRKKSWKDPEQNGLAEIRLMNDILVYLNEKKQHGEMNLGSNTHIFNTLVGAWANLTSPIHPEAPSEAESILQHMIVARDKGQVEISPDSTTYLMVMRSWVNSEQSNRGQRVAWWLDKQWKDFEFEGHSVLQPNVLSYNMVMRAWADLGEPVRAEEALREFLSHSKKGDTALTPNSESYCYVIRAWLSVAERGSREALIIAARWLDVLLEKERTEEGIQSSVETYTQILGAARKCASQCPDVLDVAVDIFEKLRDSHHAIDCLHYSRLLQVGILALSRPDNNDVRTAFVQQVASECREDGLVSSAFLRALANGPIYYDGWTIEESLRLVEDLFPNWPLPNSWTRNVKPEGLLPQRRDLLRTMFDISHHGIDPYGR